MSGNRNSPRLDFSIVDIAVGTAAILAAIFVNRLGVGGNIAFFIAVAVMAVGSVKLAFEALVLATLALCANQAIVLKTIVWAYSRFVVLLGLSGRFLFLDQSRVRSGLLKEGRYIALCGFCLVACITSLLANNRPEIALLKVFLFWISLSGVWSAQSCLRATHTDIAPWMVKIAVAACCMNIVSLPLGIANNFRDEATSQGLYNLGFYHSQTVGPVCAIMTVYLLSVLLFTAYRNRWICWPIIAVLLYSIYLSRSRTGILVLVAGLSAVFVFSLLWRGHRFSRIRLNVSRSGLVAGLVGMLALALIGDVAMTGGLSRRVLSFLAKGRKEVTDITVEDLTSSRQALIDRSFAYFRESPWYGNGFQMYANREWTQNTTIMTAQVEKGFLPSAILEETGIIGTIFFVVFLLQCILRYVQDRNIPGLAGFIALLAMNLGECSFFSFAGHGAMIWLYVAAGDLLGLDAKVTTRAIPPQASPANARHIFDRAAAF